MKVLTALWKKTGIDPEIYPPRGLLTVLGVFLFSLGVFATENMALGQLTLPLAEAFGVDRSVISFSATLAKIAGAAGALCFGRIYRTLTLKGTTCMASLAIIIQYIMIALGNSTLWTLIAFTIGGFGTQFAGGLLIITAIKPWFPKKVGIFTAICGTASGFGGQIFTPIFTGKIISSGFQSACWMMAGLVTVFGIVAVLLVNMSPTDPLRKTAPAQGSQKKKPAAGVPVLGYKDFLRQPVTWLLMGMMFLAAGTNQPYCNSWNGIAVLHGYENAAMVGAQAVAVSSGVLVWAKFIMGFLKDRGWTKFAIIFAYTLNILSVLGVMFWSYTPGLFKFFCAINAFAATATGLFINLCVDQAFGKYANATVQGLVNFTFNIGRAIGSPLIHLPYDLWGSYDVSLWVVLIAGFVLMFGLLLAVKVGSATEKALDQAYGLAPAEQ